ncbi:hypothetical protein ACS0TY_026510 [Phlomoides rotata]
MLRIIHKIEEKLKHKKEDEHHLVHKKEDEHHLEHKEEDGEIEHPGHREQLKGMMHKIKKKIHRPHPKKSKGNHTGEVVYGDGEEEEEESEEEGEEEKEAEEEGEGEGKINVITQILESLGELEF